MAPDSVDTLLKALAFAAFAGAPIVSIWMERRRSGRQGAAQDTFSR